jgi:hypothetical protein
LRYGVRVQLAEGGGGGEGGEGGGVATSLINLRPLPGRWENTYYSILSHQTSEPIWISFSYPKHGFSYTSQLAISDTVIPFPSSHPITRSSKKN